MLLLNLLESLVPYRNKVIGHGGVRDASFYETQVGPLLFPAVNEFLAENVFDLLGPPGSKLVAITDVRMIDTERFEIGLREITGLQGERCPPLDWNGNRVLGSPDLPGPSTGVEVLAPRVAIQRSCRPAPT